MVFPYVKQANTKMQVHKYRAYNEVTEKKHVAYFRNKSSNMINAESAQFTRSSLGCLWILF